MKLTDFKVGKEVYVFDAFEYRNNSGNAVHKEIITKVGKRYVYTSFIDGGPETKYELTKNLEDGLAEVTPYNATKFLFFSKEGLDNYLEKMQLERWLWGVPKKKYTLKQLRAIKKILEPDKGIEKDE